MKTPAQSALIFATVNVIACDSTQTNIAESTDRLPLTQTLHTRTQAIAHTEYEPVHTAARTSSDYRLSFPTMSHRNKEISMRKNKVTYPR